MCWTRIILAFVVCLLVFTCGPANAQVNAATITNTARVTFTQSVETSELLSNTVATSLLPLIDVSNTALAVTEGQIEGGTNGYLYVFEIANPGNATDSYDLIADFIDITAPVAGLWHDADSDGRISAGDTRVSSSTITLAAGRAVRILVTAHVAGDMELKATSLDQDPMAVVRNRSATAHIKTGSTPQRASASLQKSQSVDTQGAARPGPGTLITYALTARLPAALEATDIRVTDTIPTGTTYVPGSLRLNGASLGDATTFDPQTGVITVALPGSVDEADTLHTIRFQVRIN